MNRVQQNRQQVERDAAANADIIQRHTQETANQQAGQKRKRITVNIDDLKRIPGPKGGGFGLDERFYGEDSEIEMSIEEYEWCMGDDSKRKPTEERPVDDRPAKKQKREGFSVPEPSESSDDEEDIESEPITPTPSSTNIFQFEQRPNLELSELSDAPSLHQTPRAARPVQTNTEMLNVPKLKAHILEHAAAATDKRKAAAGPFPKKITEPSSGVHWIEAAQPGFRVPWVPSYSQSTHDSNRDQWLYSVYKQERARVPNGDLLTRIAYDDEIAAKKEEERIRVVEEARVKEEQAREQKERAQREEAAARKAADEATKAVKAAEEE
ncbi:hypothetical protein LTS18_000203, partial [Coniosporium uncinatum]